MADAVVGSRTAIRQRPEVHIPRDASTCEAMSVRANFPLEYYGRHPESTRIFSSTPKKTTQEETLVEPAPARIYQARGILRSSRRSS